MSSLRDFCTTTIGKAKEEFAASYRWRKNCSCKEPSYLSSSLRLLYKTNYKLTPRSAGQHYDIESVAQLRRAVVDIVAHTAAWGNCLDSLALYENLSTFQKNTGKTTLIWKIEKYVLCHTSRYFMLGKIGELLIASSSIHRKRLLYSLLMNSISKSAKIPQWF